MKKNPANSEQRRKFLKVLAGIPFIPLTGALGLKATDFAEPASEADIQQQLTQLKGKLPEGKLGNMTVSRVIMGCNPLIAWSHARDLIYPNRLMKAYMTDEKIIQTLHLGRQAGINALVLTTEAFPVFNKYKKEFPDEKILAIAMGTMPEKDLLSNIKHITIICFVFVK